MAGNAGQSQQSSKPWGGQQEFLRDIYGRAQNLVNQQPWEYYPGSTVASQDPTTIESQGMAEARARGGSPMLDAAQAETLSTIRGDRFNSNPYLDATYNRAAEGVTRQFNRSVLPNLESRFAGAGRMDSGAYMNTLNEAGRGLAGELSGMATNIYGGDYTRERDRQMSATGAAPGMYEAGYAPAKMLGAVGGAREGYNQRLIDDLVKRYEWTQSEPNNQVARYSNLIGAPVATSTGSASNWGFSI
jgi:hypothetical protein